MINDTTKFIKGALLGYCQSREPEEVALLFDYVFLTLDKDKAAEIVLSLSRLYFERYM